jgi:Flp pilus assembly protein TadG
MKKNERGFALIYMAVALSGLLVFSGLAVDGGRAYVVKAQLTKAVDGAALGAARALNSGDPRGEARKIFKANFPDGYMGVSMASDPTADPNFFRSAVDEATGINTVDVTASVTMPTTFMKLGHFDAVTVSSTGEAQRRMVDLSLVIDMSSSIGWQWPIVSSAVQDFIDSFDAAHDRLSLITFGNGASVLDQMPPGRGFNKAKLKGDVPAAPSGSTNMVEGIYRGWDELRTVPAGQQSGLRIIVLFTDGASNGVPGDWDGSGTAKSLRTYDFPKNLPDPDNQTWPNPTLGGLYPTNSATSVASPGMAKDHPVAAADFRTWTLANVVPVIPGAPTYMPPTSWHPNRRSVGIPTTFALQTNLLKVNGVAQNAPNRRGLVVNPANGKPYASIWNVNNAARNLVEIISDAARNDNGDYRIRLYTIGMGELVRYNLGTMPEMPEDILKRIANDKTSMDFNAAQLEGKYFFAQTAADVAPAFQGIQNQILRLSR